MSESELSATMRSDQLRQFKTGMTPHIPKDLQDDWWERETLDDCMSMVKSLERDDAAITYWLQNALQREEHSIIPRRLTEHEYEAMYDYVAQYDM